jgi:hypothetical protein
MYAIVESGSITKFLRGPQGVSIGGSQYSAKIFTLWTQSELEAVGIYEVEYDNSNKKNPEYYTNGNQSFTFADGKVTCAYPTATAKNLNDTLYEDGDNIPTGKSIGDVATRGLKTQKKDVINDQTNILLSKSDWIVVKALEAEATIDSDWVTYRASVRTKCNQMQTAIHNAANVDALDALFTYGVDSDGNVTRPLGELPQKD